MAVKKTNGNGLQNIGIINQVLGQNLQYSIDGDELTLKIDLSKKGTLSAKGKSELISSSKGNQPIAYKGNVLKLGLNIYQPI